MHPSTIYVEYQNPSDISASLLSKMLCIKVKHVLLKERLFLWQNSVDKLDGGRIAF